MPVAPPIDLDAPDLFGNDAAEDEEEEVFHAYSVDRLETAYFSDPTRRLCIARAYKGEGKSALLRMAAARIRRTDPSVTLVRESANSFAPSAQGDDFAVWVREWKKAVLGRVAVEVGLRIGIAWTDDAMSLVVGSGNSCRLIPETIAG